MQTYQVIGLMSGTSLDGLDIAFCNFQRRDKWHYDLRECRHIPYPEDLHGSIIRTYTGTAAELVETDHKLGVWFGAQVARFMQDYHVRPELIVSHGQTIFHRPDMGYTVQIGKGWPIWKQCNVPVINDLRSADMVFGGQGAPLVPVGDDLLFGEYDFCLNLGGFSNISYAQNGRRTAFDVGPVNIVLNLLAQKLGKAFDAGGAMAATGKMDEGLFERLNVIPYYKLPPPKSLGMEWVEENVMPLMNEDQPVENLLYTFTRHASWQIAQALKAAAKEGPYSVLVTGGGAYNDFLIKCLQAYSGEQFRIIIPDKNLIDFKEALVFGFLGLLRQLGEVNVYACVTGAERDTSGGVVYSG